MTDKTYVVRTYGCQMNEHDSERIAGLLEADGLRPAAGVDDADVVVLNTCCIRENADNKLYGHGVSREGSLLDVAVDLGIVKKSGAWYTYEGEQLGQGRENAKGFLIDNAEIMVEVSERIRREMGIGVDDEADDAMSELDDEPISLDIDD